jgi:hypothetical protein
MSSRRVQIVFFAALIFGASLVLSLIWTALLCSRSERVVFKTCNSEFCISIVEGEVERRLLSSQQLYELWLTRSNEPDYGYSVRHSFAWNGFDHDATIRDSKVEWSNTGMTLTEASGQQLFVPRRLYERGR